MWRSVLRLALANGYIALLVVLPQFLWHWFWLVVWFAFLVLGIGLALGAIGYRNWVQLGALGFLSWVILGSGMSLKVGGNTALLWGPFLFVGGPALNYFFLKWEWEPYKKLSGGEILQRRRELAGIVAVWGAILAIFGILVFVGSGLDWRYLAVLGVPSLILILLYIILMKSCENAVIDSQLLANE